MKTARDPRHLRRENTIKALFQYSYTEDVGDDKQAQEVVQDRQAIDEVIEQSAPEWPLNKLNRIDLAILRLAVWELKNSTAPVKVIIDEAVELAKQYGAENSPRFINGALGSAINIIPVDMSSDSQTEQDND